MPYKLRLSLGVAWRGPVRRSPAASVAVRGLASAGVAARWLPTWLPEIVSAANVRDLDDIDRVGIDRWAQQHSRPAARPSSTATGLLVQGLRLFLFRVCDQKQPANRRQVGQTASPVLGEQPEPGLRLLAVLGDHRVRSTWILTASADARHSDQRCERHHRRQGTPVASIASEWPLRPAAPDLRSGDCPPRRHRFRGAAWPFGRGLRARPAQTAHDEF